MYSRFDKTISTVLPNRTTMVIKAYVLLKSRFSNSSCSVIPQNGGIKTFVRSKKATCAGTCWLDTFTECLINVSCTKKRPLLSGIHISSHYSLKERWTDASLILQKKTKDLEAKDKTVLPIASKHPLHLISSLTRYP
jgi:hypothetical protein